MAQGRRVERVAALIRREISDLLINGLRDERVHNAMITITEVEVSGDLQHCKIYVSIFAEDQEKEKVLDGLSAATGFLRAELASKLKLRRAPSLVFQLDKGIEKGSSILTLLGDLEKKRNQQNENIEDSNLDL